jgi:amino acid permease
VLGLPHAMSWLGWVGGPLVLGAFFAITLGCALLLSEVHEVDGVRHATYIDAAHHLLGPGPAAVLGVLQVANLVLSATGYAVAAGQSLKILVGGYCGGRGRHSECYDSAWDMTIGAFVMMMMMMMMIAARPVLLCARVSR